MSHLRPGLAVAAGAALLGLTAPSLAAAEPPTLRCGAVISTDTVLHADLLGCTGDGLVVAADGVTLDLNHHTVAGDSVPNSAGGVDVGIRLTGRRQVQVVSGVIRGFDRGVLVEGGRHNTVRHITATGQSRGGIVTLDSDHNLIRANRSYGNRVGIGVVGGADNRLVRNVAYRNAEMGLSVGTSDSNVVVANTVRENPDNLIVNGSHNLVTRNHVSSALASPAGSGANISLELGRDNAITDNVVVGSAFDGIRVAAFDPEIPTVGNVVTGNRVRSAGRDGIAVGIEGDFPTTGTVVADNRVTGSAADGIHVASSATTLTANRTVHNAGLGINAVTGVRDGGGNIAHGNGDPAQCVNVTCQRGRHS